MISSHIFQTDRVPSFVQAVAVIEIDATTASRVGMSIFVASVGRESRHFSQKLFSTAVGIEGDPKDFLIEQARSFAEAMIISELYDPVAERLDSSVSFPIPRLVDAKASSLGALRYSDSGKNSFAALLGQVRDPKLKVILKAIESMRVE